MVIADIDGYYACSLAKWITDNHSALISLEVYTKQDSVLEFLQSEGRKPDILLVSQDFLEVCREEPCAKTTIILCPKGSMDKYPQYYCINKYQPADVLFNQIIDYYSETCNDGGHLAKGSSKTKVVNIFAPQGASGKTTISLLLAHQLALLGHKTLYISFRSLNNTVLSFMQGTLAENLHNSFSRLVYYVKQNKSNLAFKINSLIAKDRETSLCFLVPSHCSLELDELTGSELASIISEIKATGNFEYIITVSDSSITQKSLSLLESADIVLMPVKPDLHSIDRIAFFDRELKKIESAHKIEVRSKIFIMLNNCSQNSGNTDYPYPVLDSIPYLGNIEGAKYLFDKKVCNIMKPVANKLIEQLGTGYSRGAENEYKYNYA